MGAVAVTHGDFCCGDDSYTAGLLRYRYGFSVGELMKALGRPHVPDPLPGAIKPAGFIDRRLVQLEAGLSATYDRIITTVVESTARDHRATAASIARWHNVFVKQAITPAIWAAFQVGRLGAVKAERELIKGAPKLDLDGLLEDLLENISVEVEEVDQDHPLGPYELQAVEYAKKRAAAYVKGLGNRLKSNYEILAIETEHEVRRQLRTTIREQVVQALVSRQTAKQLATAIGDATGDWSRDLHRIARTELQFAHQHGWAAHYRATTGGESLVSKRVDDEACDECRLLYLEADGKPRIFTLDELEDNGTNVGLKKGEWKATVGPVHPNCHCQLIRVPEGFVYDDDGRLVPEGVE